ncbi:SUKH-4 family immunity protein [Streptomyces nigra]|uniref:SUKH-4 family immunity protein n=1 Tax=Streptomyces nigra TaxID=1827580 RepID=UPI003F4DF741
MLGPDHGITRWSPDSLSSRERAALNALALSERHHVRFGEWQALCSVLGADFDEAELHTIATESPLVTVAPSAHRPIGFTHERDARTLRSDIPAEARPTRDLVLDVFDAENAPLVPEDQLPAGLTHEPTRRFLTTTGFPAVNDFLSLNTHNLAGTGFTEHALEGTKDFETPFGPARSTNSASGSAASFSSTAPPAASYASRGRTPSTATAPATPSPAPASPSSPPWSASSGNTCRPTSQAAAASTETTSSKSSKPAPAARVGR